MLSPFWMVSALSRQFRLLPRAGRMFALGELGLFLLFVIALAAAWRTFPADGVKLHGNIDTGVDLFGARAELLWLLAAATGVAAGNTGLALWARAREPAAALFLLGTAIAILLSFFGVLAFLLFLNRQ